MVRFQLDPPNRFVGGLAQLGEHLLCKQGVVGSIPSSSTTEFWILWILVIDCGFWLLNQRCLYIKRVLIDEHTEFRCFLF